jgi:hypothetical protein
LAVSYEIVTHDRTGRERVHPYPGEDALAPGSVVLIGGRYWLVERIEQARASRRSRRATASRCAIQMDGKRPEPFGGSARTHQRRATS